MLDEERWLPMDALRRERNGYRDEKAAVCGSLLLHALLLLVLSGNCDFIPSLGSETRIDFLWLSVSPRASVPPPEADIAPAPRATASRHPATPPAVATAKAPLSTGPDRAPRETPAALPARPTSSPSAAHTAPPPPPALPAPAVATAPPEPPVQQALPAQSPSPASPAPALPSPALSAPALPAPAAMPPRAAISPPRSGMPAPGAPPETRAGASSERTAPVKPRQQSRAPGETAPSSRGTSIASLKGDLKVTVAGEAMKVTVLFRPFPKSRRSVEPTRADTRRLISVTPVCADAPNRSREAVVEKTGEGVYVFMVEPEHGNRAQANFTLKIYESGAAEKVKALGKRVVSGKSVLARVLMPEGILWDDEEAFTGSIQDMDSTTKFNARTGLSWKEFDESTSESQAP